MRIATRVLPALELPRVAAHIAALGPKPPPGLGGFDKQVWTKRRDALLLLVDRYPVLAALAPRATKPRRTPPPVDAGADPLHDADAFDAMSATARSALASRLGEALGAGFTVTLGSEGSVDVVAHHLATTLHLVPGGTLRVGITERDIAALDGASRAALRAARERAKEATPVREVRVAPFLVSDAIQAPVRTRAAALAYAERATLRLPSEVELEYLLREGRADQVFALENDDGDGPDETGSSGRPHRWGVAGVLEACWAADDWHDDYRGAPPTAAPWLAGSDEGVLRSGFSVGLTQSADELVFALAGLRTRGSAIGDLEPCLRLVMDLP
jgi:formylglycine-generating enzyme required for sulfatase activity